MQHGYPRPQLRREWWQPLNGTWDFAIDGANWKTADDVEWRQRIEVPFAPETEASGIGDARPYRACWYRRTFEAPDLAERERLILHFGAVDYEATVWVNGHRAVTHEGGYTPFSADITTLLVDGEQTVIVRADDDPHDLEKPRGKQDWLPEPHSIWYPRTTGIWQTVWLEKLPRVAISRVRWTPNVASWEIGLDIDVDGEPRDGLRIRVELRSPDGVLADDVYTVGRATTRRIALPDPGIDDARSRLVWRPSRPTLLEATLQLVDSAGHVIDEVQSYTALRSVGVENDHFILNGRPYRLRMVLDQGYWPQSGMTAPNDDALRRDVELAKAMGFNGVRKHQKIEDSRYLYWADRLGLLVWQEMPSAYSFTPRAVERVTRQWIEAIERDVSHPCIVARVPFNESWGVPDLPSVASQRNYVQALYHLTKTLDPSRPVIANDGWESTATDIVGIHDYDYDPARMAERYRAHDVLPDLFEHERPAGRMLLLPGHDYAGQPIMLTEFGGIAFVEGDDRGKWGYTRASSSQELSERYGHLLGAVHSMQLLRGFCYTQFTDTYQEANGLLCADRTPKFPLEEIRAFTRGRPLATEQ